MIESTKLIDELKARPEPLMPRRRATHIALPIDDMSELESRWRSLRESNNKLSLTQLSDDINSLLNYYFEHCDLHYLNALAFHELGDVDAAITALHKAVNLADQYHPLIHFQGSHLHIDLAQTYFELERIDEAKTACTHALFLDHTNQAALTMQKGWSDGAVQLKNRLAEYPRSTIILADYHAKIRLSKHGFLFESDLSSIAKKPAITQIMQQHDNAMVFVKQGKIAEAEGLLLDLTFEASDEIRSELENSIEIRNILYHHLGQIYANANHWRDALVAFEVAAEYDKIVHKTYHADASWHYYDRGCFYVENNELDMALNDFTKAFNINGDNLIALHSRAAVQRLKGNEREAEQDIIKAEKIEMEAA